MLIYGLWSTFKREAKATYSKGNYMYNDVEIFMLFISFCIISPVTILSDVILLPFELLGLLGLITTKKVRKKR